MNDGQNDPKIQDLFAELLKFKNWFEDDVTTECFNWFLKLHSLEQRLVVCREKLSLHHTNNKKNNTLLFFASQLKKRREFSQLMMKHNNDTMNIHHQNRHHQTSSEISTLVIQNLQERTQKQVKENLERKKNLAKMNVGLARSSLMMGKKG